MIIQKSCFHHPFLNKNFKKNASSGGLEPPTFRLTVERANQLRHEDLLAVCVHFASLNTEQNLSSIKKTANHASCQNLDFKFN